jgi:hypothetical protein
MALKGKRQIFANEYIKCWNATEAARAAKYKHPGQQGHRLLKNVEIQKAIKEALEKSAMSKDEALFRLGAMARADVGRYIDEHGIIDWVAVKRDGILFKEIKHIKGESSFKMHDAQAALIQILKMHGAFVDHHKIEIEEPVILRIKGFDSV